MPMTDEIKYKFVLENGDMFLSGMNNAGRTVEKFDNKADKLGDTLTGTTSKMQAMSQMFVGGELAEMSRGISNWADGIIGSTIEVGSNLNVMYKRAVLFMDGNSKVVRESYKELQKFAVYTPFELQPMLKMQSNFMQYLGQAGIDSLGTWQDVGAKVNKQFLNMKITTSSMVADVSSALGITGEKFGNLQGQLQRLFLTGGGGRVKRSLRMTGLGKYTDEFVAGMKSGMSREALAKQFNENLQGLLSKNNWYGMSSVMGATLKTSIANISDLFEGFQAKIMGSFEDEGTQTVMTEFIKVVDGYAQSLSEVLANPEFVQGLIETLISVAHGLEKITLWGYKAVKGVMGFVQAHPTLVKIGAVTGVITILGAKLVGTLGVMAGTVLRLSGVVSMFTGKGVTGMNAYATATYGAANANNALATSQMKVNATGGFSGGSLGGGLKKAGKFKKMGSLLKGKGGLAILGLTAGMVGYTAYKGLTEGAEPTTEAPITQSLAEKQIGLKAEVDNNLKNNLIKKNNTELEMLKTEGVNLEKQIVQAGKNSDRGKVLSQQLIKNEDQRDSKLASLMGLSATETKYNEIKDLTTRLSFEGGEVSGNAGTIGSMGTSAGISMGMMLPSALSHKKGFFKNMLKLKTKSGKMGAGAKNMGAGLKDLVRPSGLGKFIASGGKTAISGAKGGMGAYVKAMGGKVPMIGSLIQAGFEGYDYLQGNQGGLEAGISTGASILGGVAGAMLGGPVGAMIGSVAFNWLAHKAFDVAESANKSGDAMSKIKDAYNKTADELEREVTAGLITQKDKSEQLAQLNEKTAMSISQTLQDSQRSVILATQGFASNGLSYTQYDDSVYQGAITTGSFLTQAEKDIFMYKKINGLATRNKNGTSYATGNNMYDFESPKANTERLAEMFGDKEITPGDIQKSLKDDDAQKRVEYNDNKNVTIHLTSNDPQLAGQVVSDALKQQSEYAFITEEQALPQESGQDY